MRLLLPHVRYKKTYLSGLREFHSEGFLTNKIDYGEAANDFGAFARKIKGKRTGKNMPKGYVPESEFWLIDDNEYIGTVKIRHRLNETLRMVGGHIGYYIRPTKRQRGYGKKILKLALPKAARLGIGKALVTCDDTNVGSRKVIEANGGVLENIVPDKRNNTRKMRFWIYLKR